MKCRRICFVGVLGGYGGIVVMVVCCVLVEGGLFFSVFFELFKNWVVRNIGGFIVDCEKEFFWFEICGE